jgi:hypothetical protein
MGAQGSATLDFGTPATPARKVYYFHTDATLQGAPSAPAGNATLSELTPDATNAAAASIAGGHISTSSGVASSLLNKPAAKDVTEVVGVPPRVDTPVAAHRFGWWSDLKLNGRFARGTWLFQWREDDDAGTIGGNPIINVFASSTRDFTGTMRLLAQIIGPNDWWLGAENTGNWQSTNTFPELTLNNEYLFAQVWCFETTGLAAGKTLTFHQEGSDLTDSTRSLLQTPMFLPVLTDTASVVVTGQTGIVSGSHVEAFFQHSDSTASNTTDDHEQASSCCRLSCGDIVAGTGFTITAVPLAGQMSGTFTVRWVWN